MRVHEKLLSILKGSIAIFAMTGAFILVFQAIELTIVLNDQKSTKTRILSDILENKSKVINSYIYDYSCWDEMIQFIETPGYKCRLGVRKKFRPDIYR